MTPTTHALLSLLLLAACGDAGRLHPFASGDEGSGGGSLGSSGSGDTGGPGILGGLLYVRCPRTETALEVTADIELGGQVMSATRTFHHVDVYDVLPSAIRLAGVVAPCDLVRRDEQGGEQVLFDCASGSSDAATCIAIDPAVSHDGTTVAFAVVHGSITRRSESVLSTVLDPAATPAMVGSVTLPNPQLVPTSSDIVVIELATGTQTTIPSAPGELRRTPTFLHDGRIVFAASVPDSLGTLVRTGTDAWQAAATPSITGLFAMTPDGRDVERLDPHTLTSAATPLQLVDGRVASISTQRMGLQAFRYTNGSPGSPGAYSGLHHVYAQDPDGAGFVAMFGQHTHLQGGAFGHTAAVGLGQLADARVVYVEGLGPFGAGALRAFAPDPDGLEGPAPHAVGDADVFRPADMVALAPWAHGSPQFAAPLPAPALAVPGYDDPLAFAGFLRDPVGSTDGALVLTWTKGACHDVASNESALFGDPPPLATSGSGGLVPLNALEWLALDNPGCDAGIHLASTASIEHPQQLEALVDARELHELMPRPLQTFAAVHGQPTPTPIAAAHRRAGVQPLLPLATPFALLGGSSMLQHETRSVEGNPFSGEVQWALQGAQSSEWIADDVCGVRVLALMPNRSSDLAALYGALGQRAVVLAELPVRKFDGGLAVLDPLGDPDTSFRLRVPADTPLLLAGIDCEGRGLTASQVPFSLRPGEDRSCGGCHVRSQLPLRFDETAANSLAPLLAGAGEVQLLAGGAGEAVLTQSSPGFGIAFEFARDVWPILQARCASCHTGAGAEAGLRLDLPGEDAGSTWWRLAADYRQGYVPVGQQVPVMGVLRKPQQSRYVRFLSARGSLLYWKAANARTDGRTDADFDAADGAAADVDFGADHATAITPEELRTLARWIDTGAAAGVAALDDTAAPVLVARIAGSDPDTLVVGTVDVGGGVEPDSLTLEWSADGVAWSALPAPAAALAGTVEVALTGVPDDAILRAIVRDVAGNTTLIQRTRAALLEP